MELWNVRDLPFPPINRYRAENQEINLSQFKAFFESGKNFYSKTHFLYTEAVVLSRLIYRMKCKFRQSKNFKFAEKVKKMLEIYYKVDIAGVFKRFYPLIPYGYREDTYLPTKNILDYTLVRLQGLSKLLVRICETAKFCAELEQISLKIGHFWKNHLMNFVMMSRIYVLARHTLIFTCNLYMKLWPFSKKLINTAGSLLPDGYLLPKDLRVWLNVDWIDEEIEIIEIEDEVPKISAFFDLVDSDDEDVMICNEYIDVRDDDDDVEITGVIKNIKQRLDPSVLRGFMDFDAGEIINLDDSMSDNLNQFHNSAKIDSVDSQNCDIEEMGEDISIASQEEEIERNHGKARKSVIEINDSFVDLTNNQTDIGVEINMGTTENIQTPSKAKRRRKRSRKSQGEGSASKKIKLSDKQKEKTLGETPSKNTKKKKLKKNQSEFVKKNTPKKKMKLKNNISPQKTPLKKRKKLSKGKQKQKI